MAIIINDNFAVNVGKPVDSKYLNITVPWASIAAVNSGIPSSYRYSGLTVNILGTEYWYKTGILNTDLIEKKYDTLIPSGDFITGATNLGFFSGYTGIQTLPINHTVTAAYSGNYVSLYNHYFRNTSGYITVGTPTDGIPRRGYVKTSGTIMSWIWNEYTGGGNTLGWIFVAGNIENQIGTFQTGIAYYPPSTAHVETGYTHGVSYNSLSNVDINAVVGSLTTGTTLTIGGTSLAYADHNNLHFKSIVSKTPDLVTISSDDTFVYVSGNSGNQLVTASNGLTKIGQNVRLGGTISATTTIEDIRVIPMGLEYSEDYSNTFGMCSLVDRNYVDKRLTVGGERVVKTVCQPSHGFDVKNVIGWGGGQYSKAIADGTYDGEVIGIVTRCIDNNCFDVTQSGYFSGFTGLIDNCTYFLSTSVAGALSLSEPTAANLISKAVLIANTTTSGWVFPYAGYVISSGVSEGGPLIKNVCISGPTYTMSNSDYFVGANGGSLVVLPTAPKVGMTVVVGDVSNTAFTSNITVVGPLVGGQSSSVINTDSGSMTYLYNGTTWNVIGFAPALI